MVVLLIIVIAIYRNGGFSYLGVTPDAKQDIAEQVKTWINTETKIPKELHNLLTISLISPAGFALLHTAILLSSAIHLRINTENIAANGIAYIRKSILRINSTGTALLPNTEIKLKNILKDLFLLSKFKSKPIKPCPLNLFLWQSQISENQNGSKSRRQQLKVFPE